MMCGFFICDLSLGFRHFSKSDQKLDTLVLLIIPYGTCKVYIRDVITEPFGGE